MQKLQNELAVAKSQAKAAEKRAQDLQDALEDSKRQKIEVEGELKHMREKWEEEKERPFKNKLSDQSSGLKEAVGGHVIGWVSTCPPISLDTALAFATTPVDETGALAISSKYLTILEKQK